MTKPFIKLTPNVNQFITRCSQIVGNSSSDLFALNQEFFFRDNDINSPIEQMFRIAFHTLLETNSILETYLEISPENKIYQAGILLQSQFKVGDYRVDFIAVNQKSTIEKTKMVIIECDSQQFHDRSEPERRYEKQRDRYLQTLGYTVFRFTGSELCKEPFRCAAEVIGFLTGNDVQEIIDSTVNYDDQE